ncbi:hypothetical protein NQ318_010731 [Aromia moschata]|uniref:Uncharacterized protein n=1 Tax=Aromia moschata TaxID=1265417 RepID=A0AAV8YJS1_9CUCU|nr:hypothetical protein NQ318_010731 [Aromia moschata]
MIKTRVTSDTLNNSSNQYSARVFVRQPNAYAALYGRPLVLQICAIRNICPVHRPLSRLSQHEEALKRFHAFRCDLNVLLASETANPFEVSIKRLALNYQGT